MAILRKQQRGQYTVIDNTIFRDVTLSNKALGMLCRMLSLPDGWEFSVMGLVALSNDGKSAVMSQLEELEEHGYLRRNQVREGGKIAGIEYIVSEVRMSDFPYAENQHAENPHAESPTQSNTNISITNKSKTKDIYEGLPENLTETLYEFEEMRKSIKKPMTDVARKRLIRELQKLAGENVQLMIKILDQSILNSWAGVYPLKANKPSGKMGGNPFADMLKGGMFDD